MLYINKLKNWFLVASAVPKNSCLYSILSKRQGARVSVKYCSTSSLQIPNFSLCLCIASIEQVGQSAIFFLFASVIFVFLMMIALLLFGRWVSQKRGAVSPFSKQPMMLGVDLPVSIKRQIEAFIASQQQPENAPFDIAKAAICRETGRVIKNAVKRGEIIRLGPRYIEDRYPGKWISWGSISSERQGMVKLHHRDIEGFQMQHSSKNPFPRNLEQYYALIKPGPLYVDLNTNTLLGWQIVPGTNFEVLVMKKPDFESIDEIL